MSHSGDPSRHGPDRCSHTFHCGFYRANGYCNFYHTPEEKAEYEEERRKKEVDRFYSAGSGPSRFLRSRGRTDRSRQRRDSHASAAESFVNSENDTDAVMFDAQEGNSKGLC